MKNYITGLTLIVSLLLFSSCEDVVDVELSTEPPRLIIDAIIRVDTTLTTNIVRVKVSETNSFFESTVPANLRQISMINLDNPAGGSPDAPVLIETEPGSGIYEKAFPTDQLIRDRWFLQIDFDDKIFVAEERFVPTVPFDSIEIGDGSLFNEDDTELIVSFTDAPNRDDFYLFDFDFADFLVSEDEFYPGQPFSFSYFIEELEPGDEITVSIMGITQGLFNYMDKIIEQSEGGFGPFQTPAVTVRGNFINATEIDNDGTFDNTGDPGNFALGYFAIVQEFKETVLITE